MPRSRWTEWLRHLGLAVLYFTVITPAGLCMRVVRDPLQRSWEDRRVSYLYSSQERVHPADHASGL